MLRTIWFLMNLVVFTFLFGSLAIISGVLRVPNRRGGVYDFCATQWAKRMIKVSGTELRVSGFDHVPKDQPMVFVSNHQSWFDIFALLSVLPSYTRFVAKKELRRVPFLGGALHAAGHIYINRQNRQAAFSAYEEASEYIKEGRSAVIFAEGTRSRTGQLLPFKKGPFVLALAAQVPVVPVYLAGTFTLLPKGSLKLTPHPIAVMFGEPIPTEGMTYEDRERLRDVTREVVEKLRVDSERVLA